MNTESYLPDTDAAFLQWLNNFNSVAAANLAALKLTQAELDVTSGDAQKFGSATSEVVAARAASRAKTVARHGVRRQTQTDVRALVRKIQATPGISPSLKQQLGLPVPAARRQTVPVFAPVALRARLLPTGQIGLTWEAGENAPGCTYVVERKCGTAGEWTYVGGMTARRLTDKGCTPGQTTFYRVAAQRADRISAPSESVVVWES